jgi:hypothetical protein
MNAHVGACPRFARELWVGPSLTSDSLSDPPFGRRPADIGGL